MATTVGATMRPRVTLHFADSAVLKVWRAAALFGFAMSISPTAYAQSPGSWAPAAGGRPIPHEGERPVSSPPATSGSADVRRGLVQVPSQRRVIDKHWVGLWHTAGGAEDDLFGVPRELMATSDGVVVLDVGTLQLSAFGRDGALRWTAGRKGNGPGEFARPVDLALMPGGDIAVLDPDNSRVSVFGANGRYKRSITSSSAVSARSVCATTDGRLHFLLGSPAGFLETTSGDGKRLRAAKFPWPVAAEAGSFLRSANFARGAANADCTFSTTFGFGNARVMPTGAMATTPFIEFVRAPVITAQRVKGVGLRQVVTDGDNAALASFQSGDTLFVNFAGASDDKLRILDLYDAKGRYLESWKLPFTGFLAYRDGYLYAMLNTQESADLAAFVPAADTARVLKAFPRRKAGAPARTGQSGR